MQKVKDEMVRSEMNMNTSMGWNRFELKLSDRRSRMI